MAVLEKSAQEILLEQLANRVSNLAAEQKAREASIKELKSLQKIAQDEYDRTLAGLRAEHEKVVAELKVAIAPLQDKKSECAMLESRIAQLKQQALDAAASVKASKNSELQKFNAAIAQANERLSKIEKAIADAKEKVSNV